MATLFNTATHTTAGDLTNIFNYGDYLISAKSGGSLGGGTLTIEITNRAGEAIIIPSDLVYTSLPIGDVVSLPEGFGVQAKLAGATEPSFVVYIDRV